MTTTDQEQPAATKAGMMSNEELIEAMLIAERGATIAHIRLDPAGRTRAYDDRDAYRAELHNRVIATAPAAAELRDAIEIQTGLSATTVAEVLTAIADAGYRITATAPPFGQVTTEIARDVIAHRIEVEYEDGDIAADVVTYRILHDLAAKGLTITAAPPSGQVCISRFTAQRAQRWEAEARKLQWTPMDDERASRDLRSALKGASE